jgi:protein SCO1/2
MTALLLAAVLFCAAPANPVAANAFTLDTTWRAEDGSERTLSSLKGRKFILAFVYTSCPSTCPLTTAKLKRLDKELAQKKKPLPIVVLSLDPEHDTPAAVKAYRERYTLQGAKNWSVWVGPEESVRKLTMLLDFRYSQNPQSKEIMHDNTLYLISETGAVLLSLPSLDDTTAPLIDRVAQR